MARRTRIEIRPSLLPDLHRFAGADGVNRTEWANRAIENALQLGARRFDTDPPGDDVDRLLGWDASGRCWRTVFRTEDGSLTWACLATGRHNDPVATFKWWRPTFSEPPEEGAASSHDATTADGERAVRVYGKSEWARRGYGR